MTSSGGSRLPSLGSRGEGWVVLQFVFLAIVAVAGPGAGGERTPVLTIVGILLGTAGLAFATLGLAWLRENLTPNPRPRTGGTLVDSGPYALVRHPIYTGIIAAALGWSLVWASSAALGMAVALALFFDLKSRREEAWLRAAYPDYGAYARRVRKLVPFLY